MSGRDKQEAGSIETGDRLVSVRRVHDEATGLMLADFLRDQGLEVNIHAVRMPWLGGVELMQRGYWGHVEVLEKDAARARALLDDFYAARPEAGDEPEDDARETSR
jgi:hypothetical protein